MYLKNSTINQTLVIPLGDVKQEKAGFPSLYEWLEVVQQYWSLKNLFLSVDINWAFTLFH